MDADGHHTCGVNTDGSVACWGLKEHRGVPPPEGSFTAVDSGNDQTCGIKTDGSLVC